MPPPRWPAWRSSAFSFASSPPGRSAARASLTPRRVADMWMTILSFIGGSVIKGLIDAKKAAPQSGHTSEQIAADLAANEIAAQTAEPQAITQYRIAEIGHPFEPDKLMGYFVAIYFGKLLIWDKVLGLGTTDGLQGFAATTANLVVRFYFVKRGFENVARIMKR